MVKGNWIVNLYKMNCKNWVDGIELSFFINCDHVLEGRITHIPTELVASFPKEYDLALYLYRRWRSATRIFSKLYNRYYVIPGIEPKQELNQVVKKASGL